ncbi:MAG: SCO family protein [Azonexus sp.]
MKRLSLIGLIVACLLGCQPGRDPKLPTGADFLLQTADGPIDSRQLRGQVVLVYFGYTHCPDICPASLAAGGQALKALKPAERARVKLLMISVDPERDTVNHLKEYTAFFHPEVIGATGTPQEIAALAKAFGAGYIKQPAQGDGSYAVDHTTATYLIGTDGKLSQVIELGASPDAIVSAIRKHL